MLTINTTTTTPRALHEYRALGGDARQAYDPSKKAGADAVRRLQKIARAVAALRDAQHQARSNSHYRLRLAQDDLRAASGRGITPLVRDSGRGIYILPLGPQDAEIATAAARINHPRRKNWISAESSISPKPCAACIEHAIEYKGRYSRFAGADWAPTMRSMLRISLDGAILTAIIGNSDGGRRAEAAYTVQAGRGYQWQSDANGVRIVRLADGADYHPDSDDIRSGRKTIIGALRERADTRKKTLAAAKRDAKIIADACKHGIWVCLADSIAAGNCRAGTEQYAQRHGLDISRHYLAEKLPADNDGNSRRIAIAVLAAQRRQAHEMARGYAQI